jgi:hypothetical protein
VDAIKTALVHRCAMLSQDNARASQATKDLNVKPAQTVTISFRHFQHHVLRVIASIWTHKSMRFVTEQLENVYASQISLERIVNSVPTGFTNIVNAQVNFFFKTYKVVKFIKINSVRIFFSMRL